VAEWVKIFGAKWDAIDSNDLGDDGTAESAARDNSSAGEMGAHVHVVCDDGAGSDTPGTRLYIRGSLDGTNWADALAHTLKVLPSPSGGSVARDFLVLDLPPYYKLGLKNETGGAADYDVDVREFHIKK